MSARAGLKAGFIGAAVMIVWTVITRLLQVSGAFMYAACGVSSLLYIGVGVLAGLFLAVPRTARQGAGAGAIAGLISGGISSAIGTVILFIQVSRTGMLPGVDPQQMQQLLDQGMNIQTFAVIGGVCGLRGGLARGTGLAAVGGAIWAALRPD